jgi:hypothetical protein
MSKMGRSVNACGSDEASSVNLIARAIIIIALTDVIIFYVVSTKHAAITV